MSYAERLKTVNENVALDSINNNNNEGDNNNNKNNNNTKNRREGLEAVSGPYVTAKFHFLNLPTFCQMIGGLE